MDFDKFYSEKLVLSVKGDQKFGELQAEAAEIALDTWTTVEFTFNGKKYQVEPTDLIAQFKTYE